MYELVIIWQTGEKDIYNYNLLIEAMQSENEMKMAFGKQIEFSCIRRK